MHVKVLLYTVLSLLSHETPLVGQTTLAQGSGSKASILTLSLAAYVMYPSVVLQVQEVRMSISKL